MKCALLVTPSSTPNSLYTMAEPAGPPKLDLTFGMFEIGMALALLLTGVTVVQVWNYMRNFPQDSLQTKLMVFGIFVLDAFHSVLLMHTTYFYTIESFGNYKALLNLTWSLSLSIQIAGIIAFVVQGYYCFRVYRITHSKIAAIGCLILSTGRFIFNIMEVVTMFSGGTVATVEGPTFRWQMTSTLIIGAVSDVVIAFFICGALLRMRSGFRATDKLVDKLVTFTIGSGLLTSIAAIIQAVLYLTQNNFTFVVPYSIVAKLFVNSLLAALNERDTNRKEMATVSINRSTRSDHIIRTEQIEMHVDQKPTHEGRLKVYSLRADSDV